MIRLIASDPPTCRVSRSTRRRRSARLLRLQRVLPPLVVVAVVAVAMANSPDASRALASSDLQRNLWHSTRKLLKNKQHETFEQLYRQFFFFIFFLPCLEWACAACLKLSTLGGCGAADILESSGAQLLCNGVWFSDCCCCDGCCCCCCSGIAALSFVIGWICA